MLQKKIRLEKIGNMTIVLASILLLGVIAMAYGYFQINIHWIYLGLSITVGMSFTIIFLTILRPQNLITLRRNKQG